MKILGIDPGTAILGWAYFETSERGDISKSSLEYGAIITAKDLAMPDRLLILRNEFSELLARFKPEIVGIEDLFFAKNTKTAISVAEARGVVMAEARSKDAQIIEMTPPQVKSAVVGHGSADKLQVQNMVKMLLGLKEIPKPDDAADAIAVAICASHMAEFQSKLDKSKI
jgi:crossover junction endodeoxyribonuclease RuvC